MAELWVYKDDRGALQPCDPEGERYFARLSPYEAIEARITKKRNGKHHRKVFAMLQYLYQIEQVESRFPSFDIFRDCLKRACGIAEIITLPSGKEIVVPKPMDYDGMDELEFSQAEEKIKDFALRELIPGYVKNKTELDRLLNEFYTFL